MDNMILLFLESIFLQDDGGFFGMYSSGALGSDDPIIRGTIASMFAVCGFGILLNLFNAGIRKKMIDQVTRFSATWRNWGRSPRARTGRWAGSWPPAAWTCSWAWGR